MVIRCERCSTLYELDEALLAPEGSQVQCMRCQHVFTAFPARSPGRTLVGMPAAADAPAEPVRSSASAAQREPPARAASRDAAARDSAARDAAARGVSARDASARDASARDSAARDAAARGASARDASAPDAPAREASVRDAPAHDASAHDASASAASAGRVARSAPAPVYHPSGPPSAVAAPGRAPLLRRDTVGAFEARLRWSARWRWLGPALCVALAVAVAAGIVALRRRSAPGASRAHPEALAEVALDDAASVEAGISRLDELLRGARGDRPAIADRALAQVLRAAALVDEGENAAGRLAARSAERDRLRREQPAGWEERDRALSGEIGALERDVRAHEEKARALSHSAFESLRAVEGDMGQRIELLRGLAAYHALGGERDRALRAVRAARDRGVADGWIALADAWIDVREPDRAGRERALVKLAALSSAHPEILRARYLLARTQAALGRRGEALATIDGVLAANSRHEGAKRLRAELRAAEDAARSAAALPRAPAEGAAAATRAPEGPAGSVKPATSSRKLLSQPDAPAVRPVAVPAATEAPPSPTPAAAPAAAPPPEPAEEPAPAPDAALPSPPAQPVAPPPPSPAPGRRAVEDATYSGGG